MIGFKKKKMERDHIFLLLLSLYRSPFYLTNFNESLPVSLIFSQRGIYNVSFRASFFGNAFLRANSMNFSFLRCSIQADMPTF